MLLGWRGKCIYDTDTFKIMDAFIGVCPDLGIFTLNIENLLMESDYYKN